MIMVIMTVKVIQTRKLNLHLLASIKQGVMHIIMQKHLFSREKCTIKLNIEDDDLGTTIE